MNESKATRYQRMRRHAGVAAWGLGGLALASLAFTPAGPWLYALTTDLVSPLRPSMQPAASLVLFIVVVAVLCDLASLPAVLYRSLLVEPAYGRGTAGAVRGVVAGIGLIALLAVGAGMLVHAAARAGGRLWWALGGILLAMALAAALRIGPAILGRLGNVRPIGRPALEATIAGLAGRAGVPLAAIVEWQVAESSPTVATVAGLGRSRRVLVASDVVRRWSDDEVAVVVAHELAHHVHRDLLRSLALNAVVLCAGLYASDLVVGSAASWLRLTGPSDPAALPVVAFVTLVTWLAATPLRHAQSRSQERRADRFALALTGRPEAFVTALRRASAQHLADDHPAALTRWLFHRHPSVVERLALAEAWRSSSDEQSGAS